MSEPVTEKYFALTDSDWPWDDEYEGRAIIVAATTPDEAVKVATEKLLKSVVSAGGINWQIAELSDIGFQDVEWADSQSPSYGELVYYDNELDSKTANAATNGDELLDLVKLFRDTIKYYIRRDENNGDHEGASLKGNTLAIVKAAIAKAESVAEQGAWLPISKADISITNTITIPDLTIRNSDTYWVRDEDGRTYEACWTDHRNGYWWDFEGESPVDPVEFMPHPLDPRYHQPKGGA